MSHAVIYLTWAYKFIFQQECRTQINFFGKLHIIRRLPPLPALGHPFLSAIRFNEDEQTAHILKTPFIILNCQKLAFALGSFVSENEDIWRFNEPMILFPTFLKYLTCIELVLWIYLLLLDSCIFTLNVYSHCLVILLQLVSINMVFAALTLFQPRSPRRLLLYLKRIPFDVNVRPWVATKGYLGALKRNKKIKLRVLFQAAKNQAIEFTNQLLMTPTYSHSNLYLGLFVMRGIFILLFLPPTLGTNQSFHWCNLLVNVRVKEINQTWLCTKFWIL